MQSKNPDRGQPRPSNLGQTHDDWPKNDWLSQQLTQQANALSSVSLSSRDMLGTTGPSEGGEIPSVFQIRERTLRRRERRARSLSLAASGAVLFSIIGWGVQSFRDTNPLRPENANAVAGELQNLRTVSTGNAGGNLQSEDENGFQMLARWWEPVTVEWVDADGQSMGVAGVVAEERTSMIDPSKLSPDELARLRSFLVESNVDRARDQFTSSVEPAF